VIPELAENWLAYPGIGVRIKTERVSG